MATPSAPYDMSGFENASHPLEMIVAVNDATGNFLGGAVLIAVFIILLMSSLLRQNPPAESFFFASFASVITALLFVFVGLAPMPWVIGFSVLLAMSAVGLYKSKG